MLGPSWLAATQAVQALLHEQAVPGKCLAGLLDTATLLRAQGGPCTKPGCLHGTAERALTCLVPKLHQSVGQEGCSPSQ